MGIEARGRIHAKFDAQQVTERFRKREFVLELSDGGRYPQYVLFQLTGDRCEMLDDFETGDDVGLEFNLRGREWTSPKGEVRYFNSLEVWALQKDGDAGDAGDGSGDGPPRGRDDVPF